MRLKGLLLNILANFLLVILGGCTSVNFHQNVLSERCLKEGENIAVSMACVTESDLDLENKICDKTRNALQKAGFHGRVVYGNEFRQTAFPDLDPLSAPKYPETVLELLCNDVFQKNIESLNVRFLVLVSIKKEHVFDEQATREWLDFYSFMFMGSKSAYIKGQIIDLKQKNVAGEVYIGAHGTYAYGLAFCMIPVFVPSTTKSTACKRFGEAIANFIMQVEPQEK